MALNNSIYSVNFSGLTTLLLPPLLREPSEIAWMTSLSTQMQNDNGLFNEYLTGSTYPVFSSGSTYVQGNRVVALNNGGNNAIYQNLTGSTGTNPLDTFTWLQVNPTFIGSSERVFYNSQKITLEWALNRQYQVLAQNANPINTPWTGANHVNQIYIATSAVTPTTFIIASGETYSSNMTKTGQLVNLLGGQWMGKTFNAPPPYEFTVWVPNISVTAYSGISNSNVSAYTQTYAIAGMQFNVESY